jgi:hypothetical protein
MLLHSGSKTLIEPEYFTGSGANRASFSGRFGGKAHFLRDDGSIEIDIQNPINVRNRRQSPRCGGTFAGGSVVLSCKRIELSIGGPSTTIERD